MCDSEDHAAATSGQTSWKSRPSKSSGRRERTSEGVVALVPRCRRSHAAERSTRGGSSGSAGGGAAALRGSGRTLPAAPHVSHAGCAAAAAGTGVASRSSVLARVAPGGQRQRSTRRHLSEIALEGVARVAAPLADVRDRVAAERTQRPAAIPPPADVDGGG